MTEQNALLYDYPRAPSCQRVRIALALKSVPHEIELVDIRAGAQHEAGFRALNPQGFTPVLRIDGLVLRQSLAIIEYLDETRGGPRLIPADPPGRARVRRLAQGLATGAAPLTNLCIMRDLKARFGPGARRAWLMEQFSTSLSRFETYLHEPQTGAFCHGDAPGMADCVFAPHANAAWRWGMDLSGLPRVNQIFHRCLALPAFAAHLRISPEWPEGG